MLKRLIGIGLAFCLAGAVPVSAEETPVFSTIVWLTNEEAAPQLARYQGVAEEAALEKLQGAGQKAEALGAVKGRVKPAYVYAHIDLGGGNLLELGGVAEGARMPGEKLAFTQALAGYSRPVNRMLRWTPMSLVTAELEGDHAMRVSAKGLATVPAANEVLAENLKAAGFSAVLSEGKTVYQKQVDACVTIPVMEQAPIGQGELYQAYLAMLDYYGEKAGISPASAPRLALDLRTPVGLSEGAKTALLERLAEKGYTQVSEMDLETYHAAMKGKDGENVLADCFVFIDRVAVEGTSIRFRAGGYAGPVSRILEGCVLVKTPNGWAVASQEGEKVS